MNHADHVSLLEGEPGVRQRLGLPLRGAGGVWADLGCGDGAFTLALADLLQPGADIYAVDRDRSVLERLSAAMDRAFPSTHLHLIQADFSRPLDLPTLDGVVMANSLHFLPHPAKTHLLLRLRDLIRPGGQFILVEYNADQGNVWVPHPFSLRTWEKRSAQAGFEQTTRLAAHPSRFLGEIFSAVSLNP
jgi:SAM-dependent methyltransferase